MRMLLSGVGKGGAGANKMKSVLRLSGNGKIKSL